MIPLTFVRPEVTTLTEVNLKAVKDAIELLRTHRVINGIINNNISSSGNWAKDSATTAKQLYGRFISSTIGGRESLVKDYMVNDNPIYHCIAKNIDPANQENVKEMTVKSILLFLALKKSNLKCQICSYALFPIVNSFMFDKLGDDGYECSLCHHKNHIKTVINNEIVGLFDASQQTSTSIEVNDFFNVDTQ